ncbi:TIGR04053 family radical SAM/SPASM domain-containing protein [Archaeoglobus veneficus]|uniref:Radical SAM domain protein n=1 Tax=Archaeoglobus veneficus (strain DSM 11195 / SNP6) TaxID=693661 RepID=F2KPZ4_ARCVS|nr:TIGR04053 family radical SAM/SPASM domain-containing protein [Archaeoglobus veneficus]AEA46501.1 Radical SAM domain protein [Archaeoglobus veneficus SNP6]
MHNFDIREKPFIIFWELTRACMLACKHCRARAQKERHPNELTTEEAFNVIEQITEFGKPYPLVVITGGDPLMRDDVFDIVSKATSKGIRTAIAFSGTTLATREKLEKMKDAGIARIAISLDGSRAEIHDYFRGIRGTFETSMEILDMAKELEISRQINTTVTTFNMSDLPKLVKICIEKEVALWDVFFVVPTGRAKAEYMPTAQQFEDILNWLYDVGKETPLNIKSSAATHLRRIEYMRDKGIQPEFGELYYELRAKLDEIEDELGIEGNSKPIVAGAHGRSLAADGIRRMMGITDGRGMFFISHVGEVYPSGFLPIVAGNVRETSLKEIYSKSKIFQDLKDPEKLKGKCGRCEFRYLCGGSRARAYAMTGDYLAAEPRCIYKPGKFELIKP